MRTRRFVWLAAVFGVAAVGVAGYVPGASARGTSLAGGVAGSDQRVIVELAPGADKGAAVAAARAHGSRVGARFSVLFNGFAATATDAEVVRLEHDPSVREVVPDSTFSVADVENPAPSVGLDRIDQRLLPLDGSYAYPSRGQGVTAYVVDTGISAIADLGSRLQPGVDEVTSDDPPDTTDGNGHGTFVSDEIAGAAYGVAKGVPVVPVKVLDSSGRGPLSGILAGLEWIAENATGPSVVNMSIAGPQSSILDQAISWLVGRGITVIAAAGNFHIDACGVSPAGSPDAIAVGATDVTPSDTWTWFSDYGPCVVLSAPGVNIAADSNQGTSTRLSGTSMSAPEVTGVAALTLAANPGLTPAAIRKCLVADATPGQIQALPTTDTPNLLLYLPQNLACTTVTGTVKGPLTIGSGVTWINGATIAGPVATSAGAAVAITGSHLGSKLTVTGANLLTVCGSSVSGPFMITEATGPVTVGGQSGSSCGPDTISAPLTAGSDIGGVTIAGDTISGPLELSGNSGGVTVAGNSVEAPTSVAGTTPGYFGEPTVVAANTIFGKLACSQNNPSPIDNEQVNTATGGGTGQCQAITVR